MPFQERVLLLVRGVDGIEVKAPGLLELAGDSLQLGVEEGEIGLQQRAQAGPGLDLLDERPDLRQQLLLRS